MAGISRYSLRVAMEAVFVRERYASEVCGTSVRSLNFPYAENYLKEPPSLGHFTSRQHPKEKAILRYNTYDYVTA